MRYWLYDPNKKKAVGPLSVAEIKDIRGFVPETNVCPEGHNQWSPAKSFEELRPLFGSIPVSGNAAPPSRAPAAPQSNQIASMRKPLAIGLTLVVCVVAVGGGYWWSRRNSPTGVAVRYLAALKERDYRTAYDLLTETSKAYIDIGMFEQYQRRTGSKEWNFANVVVKNTASDHVEVQYTLDEGAKQRPDSFDLVRDREGLRVAHVGSLYERKNEAGARKDYVGAITMINNLKAITPWNETLDIDLAVAFINKAVSEPPGASHDSMIQEAVKVAKEVASRFQNEFGAQMNFAIALKNAQLHKDSEEKYSRALELGESPQEKADALLGRAQCRFALNEIKEGIADLRQARSLDPENVRVNQILTKLEREGLIGQW